MVVFALVIADVGAPKVVGGDFDVIALDIYKQVLGQQNFQMGSVAALLLLLPSALAMLVERIAAHRQAALISSRSTAYRPRPDRRRDAVFGGLSAVIALCILGVFAVCQFAALVRLWPYDLTPSLAQYDLDRGRWRRLVGPDRLRVSGAGHGIAGHDAGFHRRLYRRTHPGPGLAAPGLCGAGPAAGRDARPGARPCLCAVLQRSANPLHGLYGGFGILVAVTVVHLFTVPHLTSTSALRALDSEFESAGEVLGRGRWSVFLPVIAAMSAPALIEIFVYLFVNAMTTVSAVVFVYPPAFKLASVAVLNMDDAGDIAPAAAMGMLIVYVNVALCGLGVMMQGAAGRRRRLAHARA